MTRDEETAERNACDEWWHEKGGASIQDAWCDRARRARPTWISIEDRLPEFGHFVLVAFADGGVDMSCRFRRKRRDGWSWEGVSETYHEPPTHWMPLPAAPDQSGDKERGND